MAGFVERLRDAIARNNSCVCVGLDVDAARLPASVRRERDPLVAFNRAIIDATIDLVCAYKPNLAFYEGLGIEGLVALQKTVEHVAGRVPVIGDAKRGDIGHASAAYARALFDVFGFDAATVSPYLGHDSVSPFLEYKEKGVFVLCKTSNAGSGDFQDLQVGGEPLYEVVARRVVEWNANGNCGLVVGATYPEHLRRVREIAPDLPFLIPGVGAQAGELEATVRYGMPLPVINSSRQIIFASSGEDFAQAARAATDKLRQSIIQIRPAGSQETVCR